MINKVTLQCSMSIGLRSTGIDKTFNIDRMLVARWIKFHQLSNVLRELEDHNEIMKMLCELQQFHPNA